MPQLFDSQRFCLCVTNPVELLAKPVLIVALVQALVALVQALDVQKKVI